LTSLSWPIAAAGALVACAFPLVVPAALAQGAPSPAGAARLADLERGLAERDAAIEDLRRRLRELERIVGDVARADGGLVPPPAPSARVAPPARPPGPAPGTSRAASQLVPEDDLDRALERALVQTGALVLPPGQLELVPAATYLNDTRTSAGLVAIAGGLSATGDEFRRERLAAEATARLGLPFDLQVEATVPWVREEQSVVRRVGLGPFDTFEDEAAGIGDVSLEVTKGLLRERGWRPDLLASLRWDADTGDEEDGIALGSGFDEFTGTLTAVRRADPLAFVGSLSYTRALESGDVRPGDEFGVAVGAVLAASPGASLRLTLSQEVRDEAERRGSALPGTDETAAVLTAGASVTLSPRVLLDVSAGVGLTEGAPDYTLRVALPIRVDFGRFGL